MKLVRAIAMTLQRFARVRLISSPLVLLPLTFFLFTCVANAQSRDITREYEDKNELVDEMRARWEIKYAEKERLENLDRAREASQLGSELYNTYSRNNAFSPIEKKKLDRLEKVTKKIRSRAGGSDGDVVITNLPNEVGLMLKRLAETVNDMRRVVEKTPRQIVSAAVIERSNEVLELIRFLRPHTR